MILVLTSGGDWADASVRIVKKLTDVETETLEKEYKAAGGYKAEGLFFPDWLVAKGYAREYEDGEAEEYYEL